MANRLEQEFPEVTWSAMPPIGPAGLPPEVVRRYLERGRQLRNQAIRHSVRALRAAVLLRLVVPRLSSGAQSMLASGGALRVTAGPARPAAPEHGRTWTFLVQPRSARSTAASTSFRTAGRVFPGWD